MQQTVAVKRSFTTLTMFEADEADVFHLFITVSIIEIRHGSICH